MAIHQTSTDSTVESGKRFNAQHTQTCFLLLHNENGTLNTKLAASAPSFGTITTMKGEQGLGMYRNCRQGREAL